MKTSRGTFTHGYELPANSVPGLWVIEEINQCLAEPKIRRPTARHPLRLGEVAAEFVCVKNCECRGAIAASAGLLVLRNYVAGYAKQP